VEGGRPLGCRFPSRDCERSPDDDGNKGAGDEGTEEKEMRD
jgi:hypothetical protein